MITVLLGTALLAELGPAMRAERSMVVLVSTHVALATVAIGLVLVGLVGDVSALVWVAFAVLLAVAGLGATMLVRTRQTPGDVDAEHEAPGEDVDAAGDVDADAAAALPVEVSSTVVMIHGIAAGATVLIVLLAAIRL